MTFHIESGVLADVAMQPQVRSAARIGARLVGLWPLDNAQKLDNDVKYSETLQVRVTHAAAQLLCDEDVTLPDAEYVYEGADDIPGRPQEVVDVLLNVNDAYEQMDGYSESGDTAQVMAACGVLQADWDEDTVKQVAETLEGIESCVGIGLPEGERGGASADEEAVAQRLALIVMACDALMDVIAGSDVSEQARRCAPLLLYVNELCERLAVPRMALSADGLKACIAARQADDGPAVSDVSGVGAVADVMAKSACAEWQRHYDEVTYDPVAVKKAEEEKEEKARKDKLAAKFADVPEDPNKNPIDL